MGIEPSFSDFATTYQAQYPQLVSRPFLSDMDTPISAFLKLAQDEPYAFLLESITGGEVRGRYSFIGFRPDVLWTCQNKQARRFRVATDGKLDPLGEPVSDPLSDLRALLDDSAIPFPPGTPPMAAGIYGYLGYDMIRLVENIPERLDRQGQALPDAILIRPTMLVVFDSISNSLRLVTPVRFDAGQNAEAAYTEACARLKLMADRLSGPLPFPKLATYESACSEPQSNTGKDRFMDMVARAKEYIRAGDIFQVVLSHRFSRPLRASPFALYRALRRLNPSPFLFYFSFGPQTAIVGASPEILVRLRDGTVTVRPIAGTRARGVTQEEDHHLEQDLLSDPKELAEHLMLLDLGRNDVGRVAVGGSVRVTARNIVERYSHVMHIVSNVEGMLRKGLTALDALLAGFPAGTVSGAPKVRAMEIIEELETEPRGIYAGGAGYFGAGGDLDSAIVLRTALVHQGILHVQSGAGVVYDSDPEKEWEETCNKAKALLRAAQIAEEDASLI